MVGWLIYPLSSPVLRLEPTVFALDCHVGSWGMPQCMTAAGGGHNTKHHPSSQEGGGEGGNGSAGGGTSFLWGWLLGRNGDVLCLNLPTPNFATILSTHPLSHPLSHPLTLTLSPLLYPSQLHTPHPPLYPSTPTPQPPLHPATPTNVSKLSISF